MVIYSCQRVQIKIVVDVVVVLLMQLTHPVKKKRLRVILMSLKVEVIENIRKMQSYYTVVMFNQERYKNAKCTLNTVSLKLFQSVCAFVCISSYLLSDYGASLIADCSLLLLVATNIQLEVSFDLLRPRSRAKILDRVWARALAPEVVLGSGSHGH